MPVGWDYLHFRIQQLALLGRHWNWRAEFAGDKIRKAICLLYLIGSIAALISEGVGAYGTGMERRQRMLRELLEETND